MMLLESALLLGAAAQQCRDVTSDVIRMRDLAALSPVFSSLDGAAVVGLSPIPGAVRVLPASQLSRLAEHHRLGDSQSLASAPFRDVCFQWAMRDLNESDLLAALHHALGIPEADIELADFSRYPAPLGDLVFSRSGLALPGASSVDPVLWKGYVTYAANHRFAIWARVRIHARLNRVVATDNLITGTPVRADQLRLERLNGVPDTLAPAQALEQVIGKVLLYPVRRGATVSLDDLAIARAIRRGDKVDVYLESPVMRLRFEARAETDGHFGERIPLRNLQTGNVFIAEVSGKDQARVTPNDYLPKD